MACSQIDLKSIHLLLLFSHFSTVIKSRQSKVEEDNLDSIEEELYKLLKILSSFGL